MSRNLKPDYIRKLIKLEVPKGYKFDVANYLHNPVWTHDYPSFIKTVEEDAETYTIRSVEYHKGYDGRGEYVEEFYTFSKSETNSWQVANRHKSVVLENSNRFNLNRMLALI